MLSEVYDQLAIVREEGRHAVVILDEAQVLAEQGVLRELRGLLNLEYEERRLLTLVLVGLPALASAVAERGRRSPIAWTCRSAWRRSRAKRRRATSSIASAPPAATRPSWSRAPSPRS